MGAEVQEGRGDQLITGADIGQGRKTCYFKIIIDIGEVHQETGGRGEMVHLDLGGR